MTLIRGSRPNVRQDEAILRVRQLRDTYDCILEGQRRNEEEQQRIEREQFEVELEIIKKAKRRSMESILMAESSSDSDCSVSEESGDSESDESESEEEEPPVDHQQQPNHPVNRRDGNRSYETDSSETSLERDLEAAMLPQMRGTVDSSAGEQRRVDHAQQPNRPDEEERSFAIISSNSSFDEGLYQGFDAISREDREAGGWDVWFRRVMKPITFNFWEGKEHKKGRIGP